MLAPLRTSENTMPKSKSVLKRQRQTERRRQRNKAVRSTLKTHEKRARGAESAEQAATDLRAAQKQLDKAAAKGVIHPNKAARKKSRLARALSRAQG